MCENYFSMASNDQESELELSKLTMKKILQVLDPSHRDWVQGGTFKDLRTDCELFKARPVFIPPPNTIRNTFYWILESLRIFRCDYVLFSSLTPLENYGRSRLRRRGQILGVWFTHQEFNFKRFEKKQLRRCKYIFVHSERARVWLQREFPGAQVIKFVGALEMARFQRPAKPGTKVAWVGTPTERKNPQYLLDLANSAPQLNFRVLGKNWRKSVYLKDLLLLPNVEYVEISGALSSSDFDECGIYLMLSKIEGGPMPLLESLAAGLVPICTRTGFVEDLLEPLGFSHNILSGFDLEEIVRLIQASIKQNSDTTFSINFAKQFDFKRLRKVISGAYFG